MTNVMPIRKLPNRPTAGRAYQREVEKRPRFTIGTKPWWLSLHSTVPPGGGRGICLAPRGEARNHAPHLDNKVSSWRVAQSTSRSPRGWRRWSARLWSTRVLYSVTAHRVFGLADNPKVATTDRLDDLDQPTVILKSARVEAARSLAWAQPSLVVRSWLWCRAFSRGRGLPVHP